MLKLASLYVSLVTSMTNTWKSILLYSILDAKEFEWESQLRFYWEKEPDELLIRQCTGNRYKLVILENRQSFCKPSVPFQYTIPKNICPSIPFLQVNLDMGTSTWD